MVIDHSELNSSPAGNPDPPNPGTLSGNVQVGRLEGLRSLRDVLAAEIENGPSGDVKVSPTAALARQLRDVLADIEALERLIPEGSVVDDLASRRRSRFAVPSDPTGTEGLDGK